jgi:Uncharacterized conserved protein
MLTGQCHCGAIRYEMTPDTVHHALCHCQDCRRASGGVAVSWGLVARDGLTITGNPKVYASSEHGRRHFCGECGSSLFYTNAQIFPGQIDVQTATLDDPSALPLQAQIQTAERIRWMEDLGDLPSFDRFPPVDEGAD